jgi:hypothetical protein
MGVRKFVGVRVGLIVRTSEGRCLCVVPKSRFVYKQEETLSAPQIVIASVGHTSQFASQSEHLSCAAAVREHPRRLQG